MFFFTVSCISVKEGKGRNGVGVIGNSEAVPRKLKRQRDKLRNRQAERDRRTDRQTGKQTDDMISLGILMRVFNISFSFFLFCISDTFLDAVFFKYLISAFKGELKKIRR